MPEPGRSTRLALVAAALLAWGAPQAPARAAGARATFLYVDERGERQQKTLDDVRYGYRVRTYLDKRPAKDAPAGAPLPHKERTLRKGSFLLQTRKIQFQVVNSVELRYRPSDTAGTDALVLRLTLVGGEEIDLPSTDLRGFEGFEPPFLEGKEGDQVARFPLVPFRSAGSAPAPPALEKVFFHHRLPAPRSGKR
jgi:hypothetical protein